MLCLLLQSYSALDAWNLNRTKLENDQDVLSTLTAKTINPSVEGSVVSATLTGNTNAFGSPIFRGLVLGSKGVEVGSGGKLAAAEVFRISLFKQTYKVCSSLYHHNETPQLSLICSTASILPASIMIMNWFY